jgi:hypothetical protein
VFESRCRIIVVLMERDVEDVAMDGCKVMVAIRLNVVALLVRRPSDFQVSRRIFHTKCPEVSPFPFI